ncbi:hypothetical protein [Paenibacillus durus]|nr:hypothetical protein [Paenibacillus durus]
MKRSGQDRFFPILAGTIPSNAPKHFGHLSGRFVPDITDYARFNPYP